MESLNWKEIAANFFREEDRYLPYADEKAYREALFCYLRVKFVAGIALKQGQATSETVSRVVAGARFHIRTRMQLTGETVNSFRFERLCRVAGLEDEWDRFLLLYTYAATEDIVLAAIVSESGGEFNAVTDEQILEAQRILAAEGGVFAEPASCASRSYRRRTERDKRYCLSRRRRCF